MTFVSDSGRQPAAAISVIVPALDEAAAIGPLVDSLAGQVAAPAFQVLLVDGGSRDGTIARFRALTHDWTTTGRRAGWLSAAPAGRARQMNQGAAAATGETLVFLHADTTLPPRGLAAVAGALADPCVVGGGFRLAYQDPDPRLRLIAGWATARSRLFRIHYGDQAIFVRRRVFAALGGFPDIPLFEDLRFSRALRRAGRVRTLPIAVVTSGRRLLQGGVGRTAARFAWLKLRHAFGADPGRLRRGYPDVR
jgi:rSAM/selenodomain-associated transferase 2